MAFVGPGHLLRRERVPIGALEFQKAVDEGLVGLFDHHLFVCICICILYSVLWWCTFGCTFTCNLLL